MGRPRSLNEQAMIEHAMEEFWANSDSCCLTAASPARPAEATGLTKGSLCAFSDRRALLDTCLACIEQVAETGQQSGSNCSISSSNCSISSRNCWRPPRTAAARIRRNMSKTEEIKTFSLAVSLSNPLQPAGFCFSCAGAVR